jgi:hypothetical protein
MLRKFRPDGWRCGDVSQYVIVDGTGDCAVVVGSIWFDSTVKGWRWSLDNGLSRCEYEAYVTSPDIAMRLIERAYRVYYPLPIIARY